MTYSLPRRDSRTTIIGSTGSGKTFLAGWLLAHCDWHRRPWYILDFKNDKLIGEMDAVDCDINQPPPMEPGLYRFELIPDMNDEAIDKFLWFCHAMENVGIYIDEGYMINRNSPALKAVLTQGRSKNIQMLILVQRPVWCSKFVFSEASQFYVMRLQVEDDKKYVSNFLDGTPINRLPRFHSYWYSADEQEGAHLAPVPGRATILNLFAARRIDMAQQAAKNALQNEKRVIGI